MYLLDVHVQALEKVKLRQAKLKLALSWVLLTHDSESSISSLP
jgi:hypothetical protein